MTLKQHLLRTQQRMEVHANKYKTERVFYEGDLVFLKLKQNVQTLVVHRPNHKLAFKYYGPYHVLEKISKVAYHL